MGRTIFMSKASVMKAVEGGYVTRKQHPEKKNLWILNYTKKTQFERYWTPVTRRCRGTIVEWPRFGSDLLTVVAAPSKFFNNGEPEAPDLTKWKFRDIYITEKLDGYFISVRNDSKYGLLVASRGSFDNQYVDAAKKLIPADLPLDIDFFCELCQDFPGDENIIVTRHPTPRLVCWGVGSTVPTPTSPCGWPGEIAKRVTEQQFRQYMLGRVEGVVAFNLSTNERVKVKTQWYLGMHRAISRCTFKDVLEIVSGGGEISKNETTTYIDAQGESQTITLSMLPEEHLIKMREWEREIWCCHENIVDSASVDYEVWNERGPKEYAQKSDTPSDIKSIVFAMMSGKDYAKINELTWKTVKKRLLRDATHQDVVVAG